MLVIFAGCRATGCWQQECEAGITEVSQSCAIFLQQLCSSAVICLSGTMQAMTGIAATATISRTAANCEPLRNIPIISKSSPTGLQILFLRCYYQLHLLIAMMRSARYCAFDHILTGLIRGFKSDHLCSFF